MNLHLCLTFDATNSSAFNEYFEQDAFLYGWKFDPLKGKLSINLADNKKLLISRKFYNVTGLIRIQIYITDNTIEVLDKVKTDSHFGSISFYPEDKAYQFREIFRSAVNSFDGTIIETDDQSICDQPFIAFSIFDIRDVLNFNFIFSYFAVSIQQTTKAIEISLRSLDDKVIASKKIKTKNSFSNIHLTFFIARTGITVIESADDGCPGTCLHDDPDLLEDVEDPKTKDFFINQPLKSSNWFHEYLCLLYGGLTYPISAYLFRLATLAILILFLARSETTYLVLSGYFFMIATKTGYAIGRREPKGYEISPLKRFFFSSIPVFEIFFVSSYAVYTEVITIWAFIDFLLLAPLCIAFEIFYRLFRQKLPDFRFFLKIGFMISLFGQVLTGYLLVSYAIVFLTIACVLIWQKTKDTDDA